MSTFVYLPNPEIGTTNLTNINHTYGPNKSKRNETKNKMKLYDSITVLTIFLYGADAFGRTSTTIVNSSLELKAENVPFNKNTCLGLFAIAVFGLSSPVCPAFAGDDTGASSGMSLFE